MAKRRGKGEGTIWFSQKHNRWMGQLTLPNGKKKTKTGNTQSEVKRWLLDQRQSVETNTYLTDETHTVASFIKRYMEDVAAHTLAPRTILSYRNLAEKHIIPEIGSVKLSQLRVDHLQKLYSTKLNSGLSRRTVQYIHQFLHTVLEYAVRWDLVVRNVASLAAAPSQEKEPVTVLTAAQVKQLFELTKDHPLYPLYVCAVSLGLREGELLALDWEAVDFEKKTVRIDKQLQYIPGEGLLVKPPKTNLSRRSLPLPDIAYSTLKEHFGNSHKKAGFVFCTSNGTPYNPRNVLRHFHATLIKMGLPPMAFHNLRHTCASFHLAAGTNPRVVQEILGHSSVGITLSTYSHLLPGVAEEAAEKINKILN